MVAPMLFSLTYVSRALVPAHSTEILDIARISMRRNAADGVTGALYFDDRQFVQVLEGEEATVRATMARIRRDPRHVDIRPLMGGAIAARRFPNWAMKFLDGAWLRDARRGFDYDALVAADRREVDARLRALAH